MRRLSNDELAAAQPHRAWLPEHARMSAKATTPLGGLNLMGAITDNQYEAGQRYVVLAVEYASSIGVPLAGYSTSSKSSLCSCTGPVACEHCKGIKRRYNEAFEVVFNAGRRVAVVVKNVCIYQKAFESAAELAQLRLGLSGLAGHFGT